MSKEDQEDTTPLSDEQIRRIVEHLKANDFDISENRFRVILTYKYPNPESSRNQMTEDEIISRVVTDAVNNGVKLKGRKTKRIYRKAKDRPNPDLPHDAEENLTSKKVNTRVSAKHLDAFNQLAENFPTKREALERAIELLIEEETPRI